MIWPINSLCGPTAVVDVAGERNDVEIIVIGARSGMPKPDEPSSGYLVSEGGSTILLDCGPGVAGAINAYIDQETLTAIYISHMHADHCYDLLPLARSLLSPHLPYPTRDRSPEPASSIRKIPLFVPRGAQASLLTLQGLFPVVSSPYLDHAIEVMFEITEYDPEGQLNCGAFEFTLKPMRHAVDNCGIRVTSAGRTLAYTGDTGWTSRLVELASGADALLAESTLREHDDGPHGHLSGFEAGELAALCEVETLVLTHFSRSDPEWTASLVADAASRFAGDLHAAQPGFKHTID